MTTSFIGSEQNIILNTDSYKSTHFKGYPEGTQHVYSYIESRGGIYDEIPLLGIHFFLEQVINKQITKEDVDIAEYFWKRHVGFFNREMWDIIVNEYAGRLPLLIKALPEGTITKPGIPLVTMVNTDPRMPSLTSYIETAMLRAIWYPSTVGARIRKIKKSIKPFFDATSDFGNMDFALLDFSARGCASEQSSLYGTYAYLTMFMGSDSALATYKINKFFGEDMVGYSVPATEHSIMCSFGKENEKASFEYILDNMSIKGMPLSVVSDTWNIFKATDTWVTLADKVREKEITLVIRPDSGEITEVLPQILNKLVDGFGYTINTKGYKILNDVKVLWGDGIDENTASEPFRIAKELGISADCIIVGSGGGLMEVELNRDTCKFAMKASAMQINGEWVAIAKNPITDSGKKSKAGIFSVSGDLVGNIRSPYDDSGDLSSIYLVTRDRNGTPKGFSMTTEGQFPLIKSRANENL